MPTYYYSCTLAYLDALEQIRRMMHADMAIAYTQHRDRSVFSFNHKRRGTRTLTYDDIPILFRIFHEQASTYGFSQKLLTRLEATLEEFSQLRAKAGANLTGLPMRITHTTDLIGIKYTDFLKRQEKPDLWTPIDMLVVGRFLEALQSDLAKRSASDAAQGVPPFQSPITPAYRDELLTMLANRQADVSRYSGL